MAHYPQAPRLAGVAQRAIAETTTVADQSTVAVIEYGLIAVVIAFVLIGAVNEAQH